MLFGHHRTAPSRVQQGESDINRIHDYRCPIPAILDVVNWVTSPGVRAGRIPGVVLPCGCAASPLVESWNEAESAKSICRSTMLGWCRHRWLSCTERSRDAVP